MCPDQNSSKDIDCCLQAIVLNLREQHDLAKVLHAGPLRQATLTLLECSLYSYRSVSGMRGARRSEFPPLWVADRAVGLGSSLRISGPCTAHTPLGRLAPNQCSVRFLRECQKS